MFDAIAEYELHESRRSRSHISEPHAIRSPIMLTTQTDDATAKTTD